MFLPLRGSSFTWSTSARTSCLSVEPYLSSRAWVRMEHDQRYEGAGSSTQGGRASSHGHKQTSSAATGKRNTSQRPVSATQHERDQEGQETREGTPEELDEVSGFELPCLRHVH
jgi:hypothetical protein